MNTSTLIFDFRYSVALAIITLILLVVILLVFIVGWEKAKRWVWSLLATIFVVGAIWITAVIKTSGLQIEEEMINETDRINKYADSLEERVRLQKELLQKPPQPLKIPTWPPAPTTMPDGSPLSAGWWATLDGVKMVTGVSRSVDEFELHLTTPDGQVTYEFIGKEEWTYPGDPQAAKDWPDLKVFRITGKVSRSSDGTLIGKFSFESQSWRTGYREDIVGTVPGVGKVRVIIP